jgi:hypothetical protein
MRNPPVVSKEDFDVIIIHDVDNEEIISGTFEDLLKRAKRGTNIIVAAQESSLNIDYHGLVPFGLTEKKEN